jgi:site-specific DNA recombinase
MKRLELHGGNPNVHALNYSRRSREGGRSVERQEQDGTEIAIREGCGAVELYSEWVPASQFSERARKEWLSLIERVEGLEDEIRSGQRYMLILWMEDRSSRQVTEAGELVKVCKAVGLNRIVLPSNEYDLGDPEDEAKFMGEVLQAQREVAKMSKRSRRAKLEAAEHGQRHYGGSREFGDRGKRRIKDEDGNWRVVPIVSAEQAAFEQDCIREAGYRVVAGDSLRGIRLEWTARGIRTSTGRVFTNQSLRKLLLSPRLIGMRTHHGKLYPSDEYPQILDVETWEAVCAILRDPARITNLRGGMPRHELSGMLFCGICKAGMFARPRGDHFIYRCPPPDGSGNCGRVSRRADWVEDLIEEALFVAVENPEWDRQATARTDGDGQDRAAPLYERRAVLTGLLDRLEDKVADELISPPTAKRKRAEYERELEQLERKLAQIQGNRVVGHVPRNLRQVWPDLSLDRRRAILAAVFRRLGKRIEIHPQSNARVFDPYAVRFVPLDS